MNRRSLCFVLSMLFVSAPSLAQEITLSAPQSKFVRSILLKDKLLKEMSKAQGHVSALNTILTAAPGPVKLIIQWNQGSIAAWRKANFKLEEIKEAAVCQEIDYMIYTERTNVAFFEQLSMARGCNELSSDVRIATSNKRLKYSTAKASISSVPVFGAACASILKDGPIYDRSQFMSSSNRLEQFFNFACSSNFNSEGELKLAAVNLGIPLEGLPVPLEFGANTQGQNFKQSLTEWCTTTKSMLSDAATRYQLEEKINPGMIEAFGKCIAAERDIVLKGGYGVHVYAEPQNRFLDSFLVSIEFKSGSQEAPNRILSINPDDSIKCFDGAKQIIASEAKPYATKLNKLSLSCKKNGASSVALAFNTLPHGGTTPISLPGTSEDAVSETRILISTIAENLKTLRASREKDAKSLEAEIQRSAALDVKVASLEGSRANTQSGTALVASQDKHEARVYIAFPRPFVAVPVVVATALSNPNDFIAVDTTSVTTTGFDLWIWRINGGKFSATQKVNWIAMPQN